MVYCKAAQKNAETACGVASVRRCIDDIGDRTDKCLLVSCLLTVVYGGGNLLIIRYIILTIQIAVQKCL